MLLVSIANVIIILLVSIAVIKELKTHPEAKSSILERDSGI